jgi:hypothetical protein
MSEASPVARATAAWAFVTGLSGWNNLVQPFGRHKGEGWCVEASQLSNLTEN